MKTTRFLWMMMVALLVPAMALSGCDKKKNSNNDKDDDGSSSGSKESTEKVEKKDKSNDDIDIVGEYEMDEDCVKDIIMEDDDENVVEEESNFAWELVLSDNKKLEMHCEAKLVQRIPDIDNKMIIRIDAIGKGKWNYDEDDKLLTLDFKNSKLQDLDVSFEVEDEYIYAMYDKAGGKENFIAELREEFEENKLSDIFAKEELKIIKLTEDGFTAKDDKDKKLVFNRVD